MRLTDIREVTGKLVLKSGLHIGAGDTEMHIGGTDNPVVKHPHTKEPYIPGSSLKGKVRSLLEMESGLMGLTKGEPLQASHLKIEKLTDEQQRKCMNILKIFGSSGSDSAAIAEHDLGPTRVSFADCMLNASWRDSVRQKIWDFFEVKSENAIDRIKGTANPRFTERVVEGAVFDFSVTFKMLGDDEEELFEYLLDGLKLLEMDALGGSGSRGYGRIALHFDDSSITQSFNTRQPLIKGGS
jgi:CRISPR-associated protein Csm3